MDESVLAAVRDLARSVTVEGVRDTERLARLRIAGERAQQLRAIADLADPYSGGHDRVADAYRAVLGRDADAAERLEQHRQAEQLRAVAFADVSGAYGTGVGKPADQSAIAAWLNRYATPVAVGGVTPLQSMIPNAWTTSAGAVIDPAPGTDVAGTRQASIDGEVVRFHLSVWAVLESLQLAQVLRNGELDQAAARFVDVALEAQLIADITAGLTPLTDLAAAETAVGTAWPAAADLVLCSPADRPKVRVLYSSADVADRPKILPTAGATTGTAVVMASSAVLIEATPLDYMAVDSPAVVGQELAAYRYGRAHVRAAGAVQTVTVA